MSKVPAKPQKDTIYLEPDDDITAIVEKVVAAENKVVALVLPKRAVSLQSIVNMRLLKRNADKAGKSVVLISSEDSLMPLAGAAKIHVAKNLQSRPEVPLAPRGAKETDEKEAELPEDLDDDEGDVPTKLDYHRSVGALADKTTDEEEVELGDEDEDVVEEKTEKIKKQRENKIKIPNFDRFRILLGLGGVGIIALITLLVFALKVWPAATITIQTESIPVDTKFTLTTSDSVKEYNAEKKIIPITTKTSEQTSVQTITATGQQNNGEKATGSVTFTNCTDNPVTLPAGTGVSSGGLTFILQSSVALADGEFTSGGVCKSAGAHVAGGNVKAQSGGTKYNVGASSFSVAGFPGISGASGSTMIGGTDNITTVVSQADLDKAKEKVTSESTETFARKFEADLVKAGEFPLPSTLKVGDANVSSSPAVGQPGNTASVTIKITHTIFTVKKTHLEEAVKKQSLSQVDTKKQKLETDDVLTGASIVDQNGATPNDVTINIDQTLSAIPILDIAGIKKQVGGLKSAAIKSDLAKLTGVKSAEVKMNPFYVSKVPKKASKVTIVVKAEKQSAKKESTKNNEP